MAAADQRRTVLLAAVAISAAVSVFVRANGSEDQQLLTHVTVPLCSALLAVVAVVTPRVHAKPYRWLIALGLALSVVSDLLLERYDDLFIAALAVRLLATLCYAAAIVPHSALRTQRAAVAGFAVVTTSLLALVLPTVGGSVRAIVIASCVASAILAAQGTSWLMRDIKSRPAQLAAFGTTCLLFSVCLLVLERFVAFVPARDLFIFGSYWTGQACIALSVASPPPPTLRM